MDFLILGPLEVWSEGRQVAVHGSRQRTVLSMLLLSPGRVVSVDRLVEALWDGRPPATGRAQVAICVAGLRKSFHQAGVREVIRTSHPGYQLDADTHRIDALECTTRLGQAHELIAQGRRQEAVDVLGDALTLFRGPVLAGILSEQVEVEAARLTEQLLTIHESRIGLMLELGRSEAVLSPLTALVRQHPLREQMRGQLMLALSRSGRRAEALQVYREGREHSVAKLGLEPDPALQDLHDQILRGETPPAPFRPDPAETVQPAQLPGALTTFTGRRAELAELDTMLDGTHGPGSTALGVITGMPGVGKTSLAVRWAHQVAHRFPDGQLFANLSGPEEDSEPVDTGVVLERFLRALGRTDEGRTEGQPVPELAERAALYRSVLDGRRVLIVLDDVRDFHQIQPLLPGGDRCCVVLTARQELNDIGGYSTVRRHLDVLTPDEAVRMLRNVVGGPRIDSDLAGADRLAELCGRLPLALQIAGDRLAVKSHWTVADLVRRLGDERTRLDRLSQLSQGQRSVRGAFRLSHRGLEPLAATLHTRLSLVHVPSFGSWVGAALLDIELDEAENLVEQLVDAHLLEVAGRDVTGLMRYRFHSLVKLDALERAADGHPGDHRLAYERALGCWLGLAEQAGLRLGGTDTAGLSSGRPRWLLPHRYAQHLTREPLAWFEAEREALVMLIQQASEAGISDLAWDLAMAAVPMFEAHNSLPDWRQACSSALGASRTTGNLRGEAAMLYALGRMNAFKQQYDDARLFFTSALQLFQQVHEDRGAALVRQDLAVLDGLHGDPDVASAVPRIGGFRPSSPAVPHA